MIEDPKKPKTTELDEAKVRKMHQVLLSAKDEDGNSVVTTDDIYTEDEFIDWIGGDTTKLRKFREVMISQKKFTAEELHGSNAAWTDKYTKKKDRQEEPQSGLDGKSAPDTPTYESDETTDFDLQLYDWDNATEWEKRGLDYQSGVKFNQRKAEMMFEQNAPALKEAIDRENTEISNIIAEEKASYSLDMRDIKKRVTLVPTGGVLPTPVFNRKTASRLHFENLEDKLNEQYNTHGSPRQAEKLRRMIAEAYSDVYTADYYGYLMSMEKTPYDALMSPSLSDEWAKSTNKNTFGELTDLVLGRELANKDNTIIDQERRTYLGDRVQENVDRGMNVEDARSVVGAKMESDFRLHAMANMSQKELDRYDIQSQIDKLVMESEPGDQEAIWEIRDLQDKLERSGPSLYDNKGRILELPDNEQVAMEEQALNDTIDEIIGYLPDTKEKTLQAYAMDKWVVYSHLNRKYEELDKAYAKLITSDPSRNTPVQNRKAAEAKAHLGHVEAMARDAKKYVDATGRMLFANTNFAQEKKGLKFYAGEFGDEILQMNTWLMRSPDKRKTTKAKETEILKEVATELDLDLSPEDWEAIDIDRKLEWVRNGAHFTDFVVKMALVDAAAGPLGIPTMLNKMTRGSRLFFAEKAALDPAISWMATPGELAKSFALNNIGRTTEFLLKSGYEGARFTAAGGDMKTGAAFYGANAAWGGMIPPILTKNKQLNLVLNLMARSSMTMTASMETVAAFDAAMHGLSNNKLIEPLMYEMFGDTDTLQKRWILEMGLGAAFGGIELGKARMKGLFKYTPEYIQQLREQSLQVGSEEAFMEAGNFMYKTLEIEPAEMHKRDLEAKYKYLTEKGEFKPEELRMRGAAGKAEARSIDPGKVSKAFHEAAKEKPEIYEEVLGDLSVERNNSRAKALKKAGYNIEGANRGEIDLLFMRAEIGKDGRIKARRVIMAEKAVARQERRKVGKSIEKKIEKTLNEKAEGKENESVKADDQINKKAEWTEREKEYKESFSRVQRDQTYRRLDGIRERYQTETLAKNADGKEAVMQETLDVANEIHGTLGEYGVTNLGEGKPFATITKVKNQIEKAFEEGKQMTTYQLERATHEITDVVNAFHSDVLRSELNGQIKHARAEGGQVKDPVGISEGVHRNMRAAEVLMNKPHIERKLERGEKLTQEEARTHESIKEFERSTEAERLAREQDPDMIKKPGDMHEGISNAMKNGATRADALRRRSEIQDIAREKGVTEAELIEYDLLQFSDMYKMSNKSLLRANESMSRMIEEGMSVYRSNEISKGILKGMREYTGVKAITPWVTDPALYGIDPGLHKKRFNILRRAVNSMRSQTESLATAMEWLMSGAPGRGILEGDLHYYTEQALVAGNEKAIGIRYWMKQLTNLSGEIFGDTHVAGKQFDKWRKDKSKIKLTIYENKKSRDFEMTLQEAMTIYANSRQKSEKYTFESNGWSAETIGELKSEITRIGGKQAIEWVERITDEIMPRIGAVVNERYREDIGVDMGFGEHYFPAVKRIPGQKNLAENLFIMDSKGMSEHAYDVNKNFAKTRQETGEWYESGVNFNDMLYRYIDWAMHYTNYQPLVRQMSEVFRSGEVRDAIKAKTGVNKFNDVMDKLIDDFASGRAGGDRIKELDQIRANFVRSKLGFNTILLPKQLMSINAYQGDLNMKESAEFMAYLAAPDISLMKKLANSRDIKLRYDMEAWNRDIAMTSQRSLESTMSDAARAAGAQEGRLKMIKGKGVEALRWENMKSNMLVMTKYGDLAAILMGGQAYYRARHKSYVNEGFSKSEAAQKAYNDFYKATRRTQQSGSIEDLSHIQRYGTMGKLFTTFKNSPLQYLRMEMMAMTNFSQAVKDGDINKMATSGKQFIIYHFVLPALFKAASSGFYLGNEDRKWLDDPTNLTDMALGSMQYEIIAGAIMKNAMDEITGAGGFGTSVGFAGSMIQDIDQAVETIREMIIQADARGSFEWDYDNIETIVNALAAPIGLPTASPLKTAQGVVDYVQGKTDNPLSGIGYSRFMLGEKRNIGVWADEINRHLPKNGGSYSSLVRELKSTESGKSTFINNQGVIEREYKMYSKYGMNNPHVNYVYKGAKGSEEKADYIYDLYQVMVKGKRWEVRPQTTPRELIGGEDMSAPAFDRMIKNWIKYGVISEEVYEKYRNMKRGKYEKYYKY